MLFRSPIEKGARSYLQATGLIANEMYGPTFMRVFAYQGMFCHSLPWPVLFQTPSSPLARPVASFKNIMLLSVPLPPVTVARDQFSPLSGVRQTPTLILVRTP